MISLFIAQLNYSCGDWDNLPGNLRDVPLGDIFKLGASAAHAEFFGCVQFGIEIYIPHREYQVKPRSHLWFSAACTAGIAPTNHVRLF